MKKDFDDQIQPDLPPGVIVKTDHFLGLDTENTNFMARMKVSGSLGTATGKHIFLPVSLFAAGGHDLFSSSHRQEPIDLHYPYMEKDQVTLHVPDGFRSRAFPKRRG